MKDLTKGTPARIMISFAVPVALGNMFQLCYSLADTRVVGSALGETALAAVGATASISTLFIGFLSGLTNGFSLLHSLTLSLAGLSLHPLVLRGTAARTPSFILLMPAVPGSPLHRTALRCTAPLSPDRPGPFGRTA